MLRYIVNSKKNIDRLDGDNLLLELLKLRGVEKPQELLNLSPQVLCDANDFRGINEAIELAKPYGDDESPAFINGVLANFINKG